VTPTSTSFTKTDVCIDTPETPVLRASAPGCSRRTDEGNTYIKEGGAMERVFEVKLKVIINDDEKKPKYAEYHDDAQAFIETELGWCRQSFDGLHVDEVVEIRDVEDAKERRFVKIDGITNEVMDVVRAKYGLNPDSDEDDELYTEVHNVVSGNVPE